MPMYFILLTCVPSSPLRGLCHWSFALLRYCFKDPLTQTYLHLVKKLSVVSELFSAEGVTGNATVRASQQTGLSSTA